VLPFGSHQAPLEQTSQSCNVTFVLMTETGCNAGLFVSQPTTVYTPASLLVLLLLSLVFIGQTSSNPLSLPL
jgi:hypothetical protein